MTSKVVMAHETKPLCVQAIILASDVIDDEEEEFMKATSTVILILDVDVVFFMDECWTIG